VTVGELEAEVRAWELRPCECAMQHGARGGRCRRCRIVSLWAQLKDELAGKRP
jgi:hypothetical protein